MARLKTRGQYGFTVIQCIHMYVFLLPYVCHLNILAKNELQIYKKWRKALQYGSVAMNEDNPHRKVTFD